MNTLAIRNAVISFIEVRDHPVVEERTKALNHVAVLLEALVREQLDDEQLAASLDGLSTRTVVSDGESRLSIRGAFYTLGMRRGGQTGDPMLPIDALLTVEPGAVSVVKVAGRGSLFAVPQSERQFQRAFEVALWPHTFELRLS